MKNCILYILLTGSVLVSPLTGQDAMKTPAEIAAPAGHRVFLLARAEGTQGYVCLPKGGGASWTVNAARPEATLFGKVASRETQIMTHFLSPNTSPNQAAPDPKPFGNATWRSSLDSSKAWAQLLRPIAAGTDPSCPNAGSIPCLLLQVIGSEAGPSGGNTLGKTTYIQRLNTNGGSAPPQGCATAADVGSQKLVPYTADYYFFRKIE